MDTRALAACRIGKVWLEPDAGDFELFKAQTARRAYPADWPLASEVVRNVLIYDGDKADAAPGENINRVRLAWAPRSGVQGRPEDWGRLDLR